MDKDRFENSLIDKKFLFVDDRKLDRSELGELSSRLEEEGVKINWTSCGHFIVDGLEGKLNKIDCFIINFFSLRRIGVNIEEISEIVEIISKNSIVKPLFVVVPTNKKLRVEKNIIFLSSLGNLGELVKKISRWFSKGVD